MKWIKGTEGLCSEDGRWLLRGPIACLSKNSVAKKRRNKMVRVITSVSNEEEGKEQVIFTEDFESPAAEFFTSEMEVTSDSNLNEELNYMFPMETVLEKVL